MSLSEEKAIIAAGTTTTQTVSYATHGAHSLVVVVKGSAGAGSVDVVVSGSSAQGVAWTLLDSGAVSGTTAKVLRISPDLTAAANATAQDVVPPTVQIVATVTGAYTYGVDVEPGF